MDARKNFCGGGGRALKKLPQDEKVVLSLFLGGSEACSPEKIKKKCLTIFSRMMTCAFWSIFCCNFVQKNVKMFIFSSFFLFSKKLPIVVVRDVCPSVRPSVCPKSVIF